MKMPNPACGPLIFVLALASALIIPALGTTDVLSAPHSSEQARPTTSPDHRHPKSSSAVFPGAQEVHNFSPLLHVDGPALVVLRWDGSDRLELSISDPELDLSPHSGLGRNLTVTIEGAWRIERATAGVQAEPRDGDTLITVFIRHAQSANLALERTESDG